MNIRLATDEDLPALGKMVELLFSEVKVNFKNPDRAIWTMRCLEQAIGAGEGVFVADEDDKLVGFCALAHLTTCEPGECFGIGTYVYPEQRGSNLSSTLRTHAEDHCVALGHKRIVGEVSIDNLAALNSLAKHDGVTIVGVTLSKDLVKPGESELREWLSQ